MLMVHLASGRDVLSKMSALRPNLFTQGIIDAWRAVWRALSALWLSIVASRLVLLLICVVLFLLSSGQGEELTASLLILPAYNNWLLFISVFAWAAQSWLWAHISIELCLQQREKQTAGNVNSRGVNPLLIEIVPVTYAVGAFMAAILHLIRAGKVGLVTLMGVCGLSLFAGLLAWIYSYHKEAEITGAMESVAPSRWEARAANVVRFLLDIEETERLRFSWWWLAVITAYIWSIVWAVVGIANPLFVAKSFGTLGTVFLALSVLLPL